MTSESLVSSSILQVYNGNGSTTPQIYSFEDCAYSFQCPSFSTKISIIAYYYWYAMKRGKDILKPLFNNRK